MKKQKLFNQSKGTGSKNRKFACVLCGLLFLFCLLSGCGSSIEKKLPGSWETSFHHTLTFYSDGTYEESSEYGTGKWTILDGDVLKLTDFYGETMTYTISKITKDTITLKSGSTWERIE